LTAEEQIVNWEKMKRKESSDRSAIDGVPRMLPALLRAHRVQAKAAAIGFDWEQVSSVWEKLDEEIGELKNAVEQNDHEEIEEEFGDLMFTMVNLSRFLHVNPEDSLRKAVDKFSVRFREVERSARKARKKMVEMTLAEMDEIWDQIKHNS
ncbi:MAG TPA: MazG family protein, partial [bacterium]|nr:MazG family protein [bacterium]